MRTVCRIRDLLPSFDGSVICSLNIFDRNTLNELQDLQGADKDLQVEIKIHRKKRSLDANAMLWACIGEIAHSLNRDPWDIYLLMLKRYGKYTYVVVKANAVETMKRMWREIEVVGNINVNGAEAVQLLCYYGSSTYDSKEFSVLLNGVVSEMQEMGLPTPPSADMRRSIKEMEERERRQSERKSN